MTYNQKIFGIEITFVFRHRFDAKSKEPYDTDFMFYRLGLFAKKNQLVSSVGFSAPHDWHNNLVNEYMVGIDLLFCKAWVRFSRGAMTIKG